mmetsp:Transcript_10635/g.19304  ORF Transcript_10635/g.19304 Transcript_10635/m.19304 type:complete len:282 (-) Transcript_10635:118-963(-)
MPYNGVVDLDAFVETAGMPVSPCSAPFASAVSDAFDVPPIRVDLEVAAVGSVSNGCCGDFDEFAKTAGKIFSPFSAPFASAFPAMVSDAFDVPLRASAFAASLASIASSIASDPVSAVVAMLQFAGGGRRVASSFVSFVRMAVVGARFATTPFPDASVVVTVGIVGSIIARGTVDFRFVPMTFVSTDSSFAMVAEAVGSTSTRATATAGTTVETTSFSVPSPSALPFAFFDATAVHSGTVSEFSECGIVVIVVIVVTECSIVFDAFGIFRGASSSSCASSS